MPRASPTSSRMRRASAGRVPEPKFDWATLIANKDKEIARLEARLHGQSRARQGQDRQEPRRAGRSAHRQAHRDRRDRARQAHPDRDRRLRPRSARTSTAIEHVISSNEAFHLQGTAEAHPDPGRRLYRGRVRRHLQRARLRGDAGLSRRQHPARLRRRRAQPSARRDGEARHQDHHQADRRGRSRRSITASASSCPITSRSSSTR